MHNAARGLVGDRGLQAGRPLSLDDLEGEAPLAKRPDHQPASHVGGVGLAWHGTQGDQLVQIEVGPALGALDDVVDLKWAPAGTAGAPGRRPA
jgi:hypothetical protein